MHKPNNDYREWISKKQCLNCNNYGEYHDDGTYRVAPAHIKARGMGGKGVRQEEIGNIIPLCYRCHNKQEAQGWDALMVSREYLEEFARRLGDEYEAT